MGRPQRLKSLLARLPRWVRNAVGVILALMALRGAADEALGVAQWSGEIWSLTSNVPVWIFLGLGGLVLLTVDLWFPILSSALAGASRSGSNDLPTAPVKTGLPHAGRQQRPVPPLGSHGVRIEASEDVHIADSEISGFETAIGAYGSKNVEVSDSRMVYSPEFVEESGERLASQAVGDVLLEGEGLMERLDELPRHRAQNRVDAWRHRAAEVLEVHAPDQIPFFYSNPQTGIKEEVLEHAQEINSATGYPRIKREFHNRLLRLDAIHCELDPPDEAFERAVNEKF